MVKGWGNAWIYGELLRYITGMIAGLVHDGITSSRAGNTIINFRAKEQFVLKSGDLYDSLMAASSHYATLKTRFSEFVGHIEEGLGQSDSLVKGILVNSSLDTNQVEISFVGMTFQLVFSVAITESLHRPIGVVRCYSLVKHPEEKLIETCNFTFKPNGESDLNDPSDNDSLYVNHDWAARYIGLHLIHESLVKNFIINREATQCTTS